MSKPGKTGVTRVIHAFGYSMKGFKAAWKNEAAFRQEAMLTLVLTPVAFFIAQTPIELALLIGALLIVVITELLNSAIEAVVDRTGAELHELSGRAKDMGSAAVFVSLALCTIVWAAIIFQRL